MLKAHEVTTVTPIKKGDYSNLAVRRYIIIAPTTSKAISLVPLEVGEDIVEAHEMVKHQVIVEGEYAGS